jgi:hypothetical protein
MQADGTVLWPHTSESSKALSHAESLASKWDSPLAKDALRDVQNLTYKLALADRDADILKKLPLEDLSALDQQAHTEATKELTAVVKRLKADAISLDRTITEAVSAHRAVSENTARQAINAVRARTGELGMPDPDANAKELLSTYTQTLEDLSTEKLSDA